MCMCAHVDAWLCLVYVQIEAGKSSRATVVDEVAKGADPQEVKDGLIRSIRYQGNMSAGITGLSPASSGVGKHTHMIPF